jgi:hypothetical protein
VVSDVTPQGDNGVTPLWAQYPVSVALIPIPDNATFCGLPAALSETLSTAARVPNTTGLKLTRMLQAAPRASELPQV